MTDHVQVAGPNETYDQLREVLLAASEFAFIVTGMAAALLAICPWAGVRARSMLFVWASCLAFISAGTGYQRLVSDTIAIPVMTILLSGVAALVYVAVKGA